MPVPLLALVHPATWTPWTAAVSFLVGLSVGGFFIALPGRGFGVPRWQRASRLGLLLALAAGFAAPPCMLAALARPDRVGLLYARPDGSSWLDTGAVLMPCYLAALVLFAWTSMRRELAAAEGNGWLARLHRAVALGGGSAVALRQVAMLAGTVLGVGIMLGTGAELRPAWNSALLPWHLALTALAAALGAVLVLGRVVAGGRDPGTTETLAQITALVLVLGMLLGRESWGSPAVAAAGWSVVVALVWGDRLAWLVGLLALAAGWLVRWNFVTAGADWDGGRLLLAPAGMVGLLLVLLLAIAALAPVMGPRREGDQ